MQIKNLKTPSVNTLGRVALGLGGAGLALGSATCSVLAYQQNFASEGLVVSGVVLGIAATQEIVKVGLNIHVARNKAHWLQKAALIGLIAFSSFGTGEYLVNAYQRGQELSQKLTQDIAAHVQIEQDAKAQIDTLQREIDQMPFDYVTNRGRLMDRQQPFIEKLAAAQKQESADRQALVSAGNNNGLAAEAKQMGVKPETLAYSLIGALCVFFEPLAALSINTAARPTGEPTQPVKPTRKARKAKAPAKKKAPAKQKAKKTVKRKRKPAKKVTVQQPTRTPSWNRTLNRIAYQAAILMV